MFTRQTAAENRLMKEVADPVAAAMTTEQLYNIQWLKDAAAKWVRIFGSIESIKPHRAQHQFYAAVMRERGRRVNKGTDNV
jgi:hypothetical protein